MFLGRFAYRDQVAKLKSVIKRSGIDRTLGRASREDVAYLRDMGYPESVIDFYAKAEPSGDIDIDNVRFHPISDIRVENEDAIPGYVAAPLGYLNIASTIMGDTYCVNTNSVGASGEAAIVLVSHDLVCEDATEEKISDGIVRVADSFSDFLTRFAEGDLPTDYWDLKDN